MLVFHGPSGTGKSRLARSLYGDEHTLMVDVQHAKHPDLRDFRRGFHRAVVLDEVSGPEFIVSNKKVLQAHVDGAKLGQSATQLYVYEVFLWRVPLILTTNKWKYDHMDASDRNWIEANCVPIEISEPVWDATRQSDSPRSVRRPAQDQRPGPSPEHKIRITGSGSN